MLPNVLRKYRSLVLVTLILAAAPLAVPTVAFAQYREFSGKVDKINKKKLILDNRMGDKLTFNKIDKTTVEGTKTSWEEVKKGDWATVSWKMMDKPRKAYKVIVQPPREEAGGE